MAQPFTFNMAQGPAFTVGAVQNDQDMSDEAPTASAAAAASSSSSSSSIAPSSTHPPALDPHSFPCNLTAPSLPPAPILLVRPALHPLRGRVLVSSTSAAAGAVLLHEHAFLTSNWDEFRCMVCDKPHMTKSCPQAKQMFAPKILKKMDRLEGSIMEASCIGELDHARSLLKLLQRYISESTLGSANPRGPLADFFALSYTHYQKAYSGLVGKLPFQSASPLMLLQQCGLWPSGLSVEDGARMIAILNTNSHELSEIRGSGLFLRASLMEHSCTPNCNFATTGRELAITVLKSLVSAGENVSIDYGMGVYRPVTHRRKHLLNSHGFICFCEGCTTQRDKSRAFTCPQVGAGGQACPGIIYPVGADDKEEEAKRWMESVTRAIEEQKALAAAAATGMNATAAASSSSSPITPLPIQPLPTSYPTPVAAPWSCTSCGYILSSEQIQQCLEREKQAAKALRMYRDDNDDEEDDDQNGNKFDFDRVARRQGGNQDSDDDTIEEDDDDDEDDLGGGDEIPPPFDRITRLLSQPAPSLHRSHHLIFWTLDFYARSCAADSDEDFARESIPIFQELISLLEQYLHPLTVHDQLVVYWDYLAQVLVVTGDISRARTCFQRALDLSRTLNGYNHHSTLDLREMVEHTPGSREELLMKYQEFQAKLEQLIYDTGKEQLLSNGADANGEGKKKRRKKKKKRIDVKSHRSRNDDSDAEDSSSDDDDDSRAPLPADGLDITVNRSNQELLLQQMEAMIIQRQEEKDRATAAAATSGSTPGNAAGKKKKKKKNKK